VSQPLLLPSLRGYQLGWLRSDLLAGLTVWAVLVPESLAYATIAGVSPVVGLYAAVPALLLYPLFGSSRHLVVGPMSATAALSASIVAVYANAGSDRYVALTAALALVTGVIGLLAGVVRLGFVASFISEPVLKGFIVGLALTIIIGQVPSLLGVPKGEGDFFEKAWDVVKQLDSISWATATVGLVSLVVVIGLRRLLPLVPASLVVVLLGIAAVKVLDLTSHGVEVVGKIASGLPQVGLPDALSASDYLGLVASAGGVLLIGFAEGLGAAKTYAAKAGYQVDANRELVGLGAANMGAGFTAGMVVNGSLSKTAVNGGAGAKSQVSGLAVAAMTVITLLFLTGLFEDLPEATLAAVVIAAVIELVDVAALRRLYQLASDRLTALYGISARVDFIAAATAMFGVLLFDTLPGLLIGVVVSVVLLVYRASRSYVATLVPVDSPEAGRRLWLDSSRHPDVPPEPDIVVLRVESSLFFANADHTRDAIRAAVGPATRAVVLDCASAPFVDVTAAEMLAQLSRDLGRDDVRLLLARSVGPMREELRASGVLDDLGHPYPTIDGAVTAARRPTVEQTPTTGTSDGLPGADKDGDTT
jgi:sulfate permease, SulP family